VSEVGGRQAGKEAREGGIGLVVGESGGECVFGIRELEWSGEVSGAG
jgi:hypothetical protein